MTAEPVFSHPRWSYMMRKQQADRPSEPEQPDNRPGEPVPWDFRPAEGGLSKPARERVMRKIEESIRKVRRIQPKRKRPPRCAPRGPLQTL